MKILAFDTSNNTLSVSILINQKIAYSYQSLSSNSQAELLVPEIEKSLQKTNIWYEDLDLIAVTNGPGSFTGVRIAFSVAKALKLATNLPLLTASSLEIIAYPYCHEKYLGQNYQKVLVAIDAKLDQLFIQQFEIVDGEIQTGDEAKLIKIAEIADHLPKEKFLLAGSANDLIKDLISDQNEAIISENNDFAHADNLAHFANDKFQNRSKKDVENDILYIREPRISKRKDAK